MRLWGGGGTYPHAAQEAAHQNHLANGAQTHDCEEAQAVGVAMDPQQLTNGRGETDEQHKVGQENQCANEGQLAALQ